MKPTGGEPAPEGPGGRVLVVFESSAVRETISLLHLRGGFQTESVDRYSDALTVLESFQPETVLISAVASQERARELAGKIRNHPCGADVPVALVAVRFAPGDREQAARAGADACLDLAGNEEDYLWRIGTMARSGRRRKELAGEVRAAEARARALAQANAEAGRLILEIEERDRRIQEQQSELGEQNRRLAQANAEAGRLILDVEEKDRRLQGQSAEIERHLSALRRDLAIAADLQINLLPVEHPNVRSLRLFDRFLPAAELCGDYYDYILHPDGDFDVVVADVTGHGVASALVSVQIRAITRARGPFEKSPARTLKHLNDFMVANFHRQFLMTMFCLGYRAAGRSEPQLVYAGAGHTPPLVLRADGRTEEIRSQGMPLGVETSAQFGEDVMQLAAGERLLIYTDGVIEVYDGSRHQWGVKGLARAFSAGRELAGREVIDQLLRESRYFGGQRPFDDDITVVLVERAAE